MISPNYGCSQADLYTICRLVWLLCIEHILKYGAYKSKYTLAYANENLALVKTVEAMPTYSLHLVGVKNSKKDVGAEQSDAAIFFKQLQGYVKEAYQKDKTLYDAQMTEAGKSNYTKVTKGDWREVKGLYSAMTRFVQNYQDVLTKDGSMPADFLTRIQKSQTAFEVAHQTYKTDSETAPDTSEAKISANNDLKARAVAALEDGRIAHADDKITAQKFVWNTIQAEVRGARPSGLGGTVTDDATKAPLSIGAVRILELDKTVTTDDKGRYEFPSLPVGTYTLEYTAEGYETQIVKERTIKLSVMGRLNIALVAKAG